MSQATTARLVKYLNHYAAAYNSRVPLWQRLIQQHFRVPDRPAWSFLSMAEMADIQLDIVQETGVSWATATPEFTLGLVRDLSVMSALGTWQVTRGIYRLDHTLLRALWDTPITGELPGEMLTRLPEWCVYVETPIGETYLGHTLHGFWAHLDPDPRGLELRLLPDIAPLAGEALPGWFPLAIPLSGTLADGVQQYHGLPDALPGAWSDWAGSAISVLLYLCTREVEYDELKPQVVAQRKLRRAQYPRPNAERLYVIGSTLGAALRQTEGAQRSSGSGSEKRFHLRRLHWQTVWVGEKGNQHREKRFIPTLKIRPDRMGEDGPLIVHPVRAEE